MKQMELCDCVFIVQQFMFLRNMGSGAATPLSRTPCFFILLSDPHFQLVGVLRCVCAVLIGLGIGQSRMCQLSKSLSPVNKK